jgi:hypothetical protein
MMPDIEVQVAVTVDGRYSHTATATASQGNPLFNATQIERALGKAAREVMAAVVGVDGDIRDSGHRPDLAQENRIVTRAVQ